MRDVATADTRLVTSPALADLIPAPVMLIDGQGHVRYANEALRAVTGAADVVLAELGWRHVVHPEDHTRALDALLAAREPPILRLRAADGSFARYRCRHALEGELTWIYCEPVTAPVPDPSLSATAGELLYERAPIGIVLFDSDFRFLRINETLASLNGRPVEAHLGRSIEDVLDRPTVEALRAIRPRLLAGEAVTELAITDRDAAGRSRGHYQVSYRPLTDADGAVRWFVGTVLDVTARREAELELARSEARLALALRAGCLGVHSWDIPNDRIDWDATVRRLWGVADDQPITYDVFIRGVHPDDRAAVGAAVAQCLDPKSDGVYAAEYRVVNAADGATRWIAATGQVLFEADVPSVLIGTVRDVTERKHAEEQLALLAHELDHRARNMLSVVASVVRLSEAPDAAELKATIEGRVDALARAHALLAQTRWDGADLRRLVGEELEPFGLNERVSITGPLVRLAPGTAQTMALALHELATNAAKHGSLSGANGRVDVHWAWAENGRSLVLVWEEGGGPAVSKPERQGLGSSLIQGAIRDRLDGGVEVQWQPSGLRAVLRIPRAHLAEP